MKSKTMIMVLSMAVISLFTVCEKKGPMEKAGEQIDKTVDEAQEKTKDIGKDIKKSINE